MRSRNAWKDRSRGTLMKKLRFIMTLHPGVEFGANLKSISRGCHLFEVAFVRELTKETIHLPLGSLQGGIARFSPRVQGGGRPNVGEKDVKVCKACCGGLARHHPGAPTIPKFARLFFCTHSLTSVQIPQLFGATSSSFRYKFLNFFVTNSSTHRMSER